MKELAQGDFIYERQLWPRQEAIDFFTRRGEPLKVQLIEEKTAGQPEVSVYTIKDKDTFVDFCVGPHVPTTGAAQGVQADGDVERVLEGRREERADAARLRHGVLLAEGARRAPRRASKKRRSAITASSARSSACSRSIRGRRAPLSGRRKGTTLYNTLVELHARRLIPAGYPGSEDAARLQQGRCGSSQATGRTTGRTCSWCESPDGDEMGLKPMNCPGHYLLYRQREAQLQGIAAPVSRADAAAPQRGVRHACRA